MYKYLLYRLSRRPSFYFALLIGSFITLAQLKEIVGYPVEAINSLYTHWIESLTGSPLPSIYWLIFPLIVALPLSSILLEDEKKNYLHLLQVKGNIQQYLNKLFKFNFLIGGITGIIPLVLNFVSVATLLPAIRPNLILDGDGNIAINATSPTLFPEMYYDHPLLHVLLYLLIGFLVGGLLASIGLIVSLMVKNVFVAVASAFLFTYVLKFLMRSQGSTWENSLIPTNYANQISPIHGISFLIIAVSYISMFIIIVALFIWRKKKYVV